MIEYDQIIPIKKLIYFNNHYFFGLKTKQIPLLQYLFPVGCGPSSKICP